MNPSSPPPSTNKLRYTALGCLLMLGCACISLVAVMFSPVGLCMDIFGGQVPPDALGQFIDQTLAAAATEDYTWLQTVSSPEAAAEVQHLAPRITPGYELLLADNLAGLYEYKIQFDTGLIVYLTLSGNWPTCPDFNITPEEISAHLRLESFEEVTE